MVSSCMRSLGIMIEICLPIASWLKSQTFFERDSFQLVIMPSRVLLIIASSEEFTIAASIACFSSASFFVVISLAIFEAPIIFPALFFMGEIVREISIAFHLYFVLSFQNDLFFSHLRILSIIIDSSCRRFLGMIREMCLPIASFSVKPNIFWAE